MVVVNLHTAKAKVAPLKRQTVQRLELLGCSMLSKLISSVKNAINGVLHIEKVHYWSESKICLSWIHEVNKEWKCWVENRVNSIRSLSNIDDWHFVSGTKGSRGMDYKMQYEDELTNISIDSELKKQKLNLNGMVDVKNMFHQSEVNTVFSKLENTTVVKSVSIETIVNLHEILTIDDYSSMNKLLLLTSYVIRIINNFLYRRKGNKGTGYSNKLQLHAELIYLSILEFYLNDSDGVLRLHGHFPNVLVELGIKHPIYLQTDSMFTKLLILRAHEKTDHAGINSTLIEIRSKYWFA
ncbi:uncharacterized protein LOC124813934 [Hydra vulgaris]|uniref:uncharacterized protein LOC124813934 n=1 Tax=Hydra vulgaris TaxID=6087 RepID=UPI001F5E709E|nr:uncharacterized protein LOC124813934 [Hydra vulgaris]